MARLNQTIKCKKDGVTEEINIYTTLEEVSNKGVPIKVNGELAYMRYDVEGTGKESVLNCKIPNDTTTYKIIKESVSSIYVTLRCFDVETETQISAVAYPAPGNGVLYLNNENAPSIKGYDFVMMDGIKHTNVVDNDVFDVWYISQSVPDRSVTTWTNVATEAQTVLVNTYSAVSMLNAFNGFETMSKLCRINTSNVTDMRYMFRNCKSLTNIPEMDTSNVTRMHRLFYECTSLVTVPKLDTSKNTNCQTMFYNCSSLNTIDWEIDMSSCTNCTDMFTGCPATNIRLKNVPSSLSLSGIGTTNYTVVNYI